MSSFIGRRSIVLAAVLGAAFLSAAPPASATDYRYCQQQYDSGMRDCSFDTMEQCVAMISGHGGSCARNPYLPEPRESYAYVHKGGSHRLRR